MRTCRKGLHKVPSGIKQCPDCYKSAKRLYKSNNKEKESLYKKANYDFLKEKNRKLFHEYGITLEKFNEMLIRQNQCCAICNKTDTKKSLCVDHCHKTGKIRGLLCNKCNKAIGLLNDDCELLKTAYSYLEHFKEDL